METINNMNPLFKTGQAGDFKDFIIFVLAQLHKELKKPININNVKAEMNFPFIYFFKYIQFSKL